MMDYFPGEYEFIDSQEEIGDFGELSKYIDNPVITKIRYQFSGGLPEDIPYKHFFNNETTIAASLKRFGK